MNDSAYVDSADYAAERDAADPLARFRDAFVFPRERDGRAPVYFCGNSLGLQSEIAERYVLDELRSWADYAVDGHFQSPRPWLDYHRRAAHGFALLTGATEREVVAMNTLTVNLHLMMATFYRPEGKRCRIVVEEHAFPSDNYAAQSQLRLHGFDPKADLLIWRTRDDGLLHNDDLTALLDGNRGRVALLLLPGVQYYTGQVLDMQAICELGRRYDCAVGLDLAHAIGNVRLALHDWAPDFACWCTYKYLNAGPGAIAGAFVHERHLAADRLDQLHGWWGNAEATRFRMAPEFDPADGAERWQQSNPPILSLAPVVASLQLFEDAGLDALRERSRRLTGYFDCLLRQRFSDVIDILTPPKARGAQLSLVVGHGAGRGLFDRLHALNVIGDWREPDVMRFAPAPLYNNFADVHTFAERLDEALAAS